MVNLYTLSYWAALFFIVLGAVLGLLGVWVDDFWDSPTPIRLLITDFIFAGTSILVAVITRFLGDSK